MKAVHIIQGAPAPIRTLPALNPAFENAEHQLRVRIGHVKAIFSMLIVGLGSDDDREQVLDMGELATAELDAAATVVLAQRAEVTNG